MVRKESEKKAAGLCIVAFVVGCLVCLFMGCAEAHAKIDYSDQYQLEYKWPVKKSWRQIIKEVLKKKRKQIEPPIDMNETFPIPLYYPPEWEKNKNIA